MRNKRQLAVSVWAAVFTDCHFPDLLCQMMHCLSYSSTHASMLQSVMVSLAKVESLL